MSVTLKLIQIGNSLGITLPKDVISSLKVEKGDRLTITETADGFRISSYDPKVQQQVDAGREIMNEFRDTLRALAK